MIYKLQKNTLVKSQVVGYALTLCIGVCILLTVVQLYYDVKPLLQQQTDVFSSKYAVVSKHISAFRTVDKSGIYFSADEQEALQKEPFVKSISHFTPATFKIGAYTGKDANLPLFYTDLFFESIPDKYLDVQAEDWQWQQGNSFVPIIIPESYLNLYNFGFAESQGLPVFSKSTISQISFHLEVKGNGKQDSYESRIVGFSSKINSILVPQHFLDWANKEYGNSQTANTSRLLVEFEDPSDERVLEYFNANDLSINKDELELSKMSFFFHWALLFVFAIALIIIVLSVAFILLSINLIIQKHKEQIVNLYYLGYKVGHIAKFYQIVVSVVTLLSVGVAVAVSMYVRKLYTQKLNTLFEFGNEQGILLVSAVAVLLVLGVLYNYLVRRSIGKLAK